MYIYIYDTMYIYICIHYIYSYDMYTYVHICICSFTILGLSAALSSFGLLLAHGGIDTTCILQTLHDALALKGPLNNIREIAERVQEHKWLLNYPVTPMPSCYKGIQIAVLKILSIDESCAVSNKSLYGKCLITFPVETCGTIIGNLIGSLDLRNFSKVLFHIFACVG